MANIVDTESRASKRARSSTCRGESSFDEYRGTDLPSADHSTSFLPDDVMNPSVENCLDVVESLGRENGQYKYPRGVSVTDDVLKEAFDFLGRLEGAAKEQTLSIGSDKSQSSILSHPRSSTGSLKLDLAVQAYASSEALRNLMDHYGTKGGKGRKAIKAAGSLLHEDKDIVDIETVVPRAVALLLVMSALAIGKVDGNHMCDIHRAVSRAASSGILPEKPISQQNENEEYVHLYNALAGHVTQSLLEIAINEPVSVDLHIVTSICRSCLQNVKPLAASCAVVVRNALQLSEDNPFDETTPLPNIEKIDAITSLGLAAQIGPWTNIRPCTLVEIAVAIHLWHAAERICDSASKSAISRVEIDESVHVLVDAASDQRFYRQADAFATQFYNYGGRSRYAETRLMHACDTIAKVIARRQIPIAERQVERVDSAYARVREDLLTQDDVSETEKIRFDDAGPSEVRDFTLLRLKEVGEHNAAYRFANLWNMEYSFDPEEAQRLAQARREKYLQWEDCLADTDIPDLISQPSVLLRSFEKMEASSSGAIGFDCEWGEENNVGAAVLQLSTCRYAILLDIPQLTSTKEGCEALERTIGRLFSNKDRPVVGFACREDVSRLRASPTMLEKHWLGSSAAVIDVKPIVGHDTQALKQIGRECFRT